jgi:methyltransferase (TIGR00027 family)
MRAGRPSRTARGAAAYRAIHQTLEGGCIFKDPFALDILDEETRATLDDIAADVTLTQMRLFLAARSRFSEDTLSSCVARGVRQVVVLGAGLDTFALRNPHGGEGVRVFEVDYPTTQQWKRERLRQAGLAVPNSLIFAPIDFEREGLAQGLARAGFRSDHPAYFQWLGVVPYLTREAVTATLDFIAGIAGSAVVFDYMEPLENHGPGRRAHLQATAEKAAALGEPWLSFFEPADLSRTLHEKGFVTVEDLGMADIAERFYGTLKDGLLLGSGGHVLRADCTG